MSNYDPSPVPNNPADLKRYLDDELARIAAALNGAVMVAFGGMVSNGVHSELLTVTPAPLLVFDQFEPAREIGVLPDVTDSTLTVLDGGVYQALFVATVSSVPQGTQVFIEFTVNGVQARTILVDPSNQTAATSVAFSSLVRLARGSVVAVVAYVGAGTPTVDFEDVSFFLTRVSGRDA